VRNAVGLGEDDIDGQANPDAPRQLGEALPQIAGCCAHPIPGTELEQVFNAEAHHRHPGRLWAPEESGQPPPGAKSLHQLRPARGLYEELTTGLDEHLPFVPPEIQRLRRCHEVVRRQVAGEVLGIEPRLEHERRLGRTPWADQKNYRHAIERAPSLHARGLEPLPGLGDQPVDRVRLGLLLGRTARALEELEDEEDRQAPERPDRGTDPPAEPARVDRRARHEAHHREDGECRHAYEQAAHLR
jgi:hypothetical protein